MKFPTFFSLATLVASQNMILAPYIDVTQTVPIERIKPSGLNFISLGFALADCLTMTPVWTTQALDLNSQKTLVNRIRAQGADVIVSLGGALVSEQVNLPAVCGEKLGKSPQEVANIYKAFVDAYNLTRIDFDIEGENLDNDKSVSLRSKAIALLQTAYPSLKVSYTLPVAQSGLLTNAINSLKSAMSDSVKIDIVNIMTMNYAVPIADMGRAAIRSANGTLEQLENMNFKTFLGITPMLGDNDTPGENFSVQDAEKVVEFALATDSVKMLSYWSMHRDTANATYLEKFSKFKSAPKLTTTTTTAEPTTTTTKATTLIEVTSEVVPPSTTIIPPPVTTTTKTTTKATTLIEVTSEVVPPSTTIIPPPVTTLLPPPPPPVTTLLPPTSPPVTSRLPPPPPVTSILPPPPQETTTTIGSIEITSTTSAQKGVVTSFQDALLGQVLKNTPAVAAALGSKSGTSPNPSGPGASTDSNPTAPSSGPLAGDGQKGSEGLFPGNFDTTVRVSNSELSNPDSVAGGNAYDSADTGSEQPSSGAGSKPAFVAFLVVILSASLLQ